jgi:nucleoside-diphosphate-sugar epimerase
VLNDFVAAAVTARRIEILSDGTPWRPLIDVQDMARAIEWAIGRSSADGNFIAVNAGRSEWNYQIKDLAEAVSEIIPGTEISINKDAQPDKRSYRVNFDLYRQLASSHLPQVGLKQSIIRIKDGLEGMDFLDKDFRNSDYVRLKVLADLRHKALLNDKLQWMKGVRC